MQTKIPEKTNFKQSIKNIFAIFRHDLKALRGNITAWITIIGLGIIPSLYAWFYLASAWDPYGNTKGISFAVSSLDQGALLSGKRINIGDTLIENLKENDKIGWQFVDERVAREGVEKGKYVAAIIIDPHFTQDLLSFVTDIPHQGKVDYIVNQKTNAIAAKISFQGMNSIINTIQENFVYTLNKTVFETVNTLGITLKEQEPLLQANLNLLNNLNATIQSLDKDDENLISQLDLMQELISLTQENLPNFQELLLNSQNTLSNLSDFSVDEQRHIDTQLKNVQNQLFSFDRLLSEAKTTNKNLAKAGSKGEEALQEDINDLSSLLAKLESNNKQLNNNLEEVNNFFEDKLGFRPLESLIVLNQGFILNLQQQQDSLQFIANKSDKIGDSLTSFSRNLGKLFDTQQSALSNFDKHIADRLLPFVEKSSSNIQATTESINALLETIDEKVPLLDEGFELSKEKLQSLQSNLNKINKQLPKIKSNISTITHQLNKLKSEKGEKIVDQLLAFDPYTQANMASNIVAIHETNLFDIPNYGSGMAPFFSVLALWTGAILLINILSTNLSYTNTYRPREQILGKMMLFLLITGIQSLILSLGNIFLLKAYTAAPVVFILSSLIISWVRAMITFSLVKTFGNVGKVLVVILLVLQLTGAGGTFPVEISGNFFQIIHPFLPFTYAIAILREAVGGVVWADYWANLLVLLGFGLLFLLMAMKRSPRTEKFVKKMDENLLKTGLTGH